MKEQTSYNDKRKKAIIILIILLLLLAFLGSFFFIRGRLNASAAEQAGIAEENGNNETQNNEVSSTTNTENNTVTNTTETLQAVTTNTRRENNGSTNENSGTNNGNDNQNDNSNNNQNTNNSNNNPSNDNQNGNEEPADTTAPEITGIEDGKVYAENVTATINADDLEKAICKFVAEDGTESEYEFSSGKEFTESGKYILIVIDKSGNKTEISFTIDKNAPEITGVENGKIYNVDVTPVISDKNLKKVTYKLNDGEENDLEEGTTLVEEGIYTITAEDEAGNKVEISFEIDKTAPVYTNLGIIRNKTQNDTRDTSYAKDGDSVRVLVAFAEKLAVEPTVKVGDKEYVATYRPLSSNEAENVFYYMADIDVTEEIPEGKIEFSIEGYADVAGNVGTTLSNTDINMDYASVTVDRTVPVLTVKDESVGTDPYYSKISFKLYDNNAIVKYILNGTERTCTPNNYSDANYDNIKSLLVEGENTITLVDIAGNEVTRTFIYDTTKPTITWNGNVYEDGAETIYTNGRFTVNASDENGISKVYSNNHERKNGWSASGESKYTIKVVDMAGNEAIFTVVIDKTMPKLKINGTEYADSTEKIYLNAENYEFENVDKNADKIYVDENEVTDAIDLAEGTYSVKLTDKAGNEVTYTLVVDRTAPVITVKDESIGTDPYYSKISFKLYDNNAVVKYILNGTERTCTPNNYSDANYDNIKSLLVEGENTITLVDIAGNEVTRTFIYDTTKPTITWNGNVYEDGAETIYTNGRFTVNASDENGISKVYSNNHERKNGWSASGESKYTIKVVDMAGNEAIFTVVIDKTMPKLKINGTEYADSTEKIYLNAENYEFENVDKNADKIYVDENEVTDAIDLAEGTYSVKLTDKAGNEVTYTLVVDRTAPVLTVKDESIGTDPYYSKISFKLYDNNAVVKYILNGTEKICKPNSYSDANYGNIKNLLVEGENTITLVDIAGNETTRTFIYDTTAPVYTTLGIVRNKTENDTRNQAYAKDGDSVRILISFAEKLAVEPTIKIGEVEYLATYRPLSSDESNNVFFYMTDIDVTTEIPEGEIKFSVNGYADAAGNVGKTLTNGDINRSEFSKVIVDRTLPEITVKDESIGTDPYYSKISFKLYDNNAVVKYILNGTEKTCKPNNYSDANYGNIKNLLVEGENTITLVDIAGNEVTRTFVYDTTAPVLTLCKYEDKYTGRTVLEPNKFYNYSVAVIIDEANLDTSILLADDKTTEDYISGNEIGARKDYKLTVTDKAGNVSEIEFGIDKDDPKIEGVENGKYYNVDVTPVVTDKHLDTVRYRFNDGEEIDFVEGTVFSKEGKYEITAIDKAGNKTVKTFYIDKTLPEITLTDDSIGTDPYYSRIGFKLHDNNAVVKYILNGTERTCSVNPWSDANYNDIKYLLVEGENTITLVDIAGNEVTRTFIYDITSPTAVVTYSNDNGKAMTNQDVTVTLTASEDIKDIEGWTKVDSKTFTKVYGENGKHSVEIEDKAGNKTTINYEVKRIDKVAPVIDLSNTKSTFEVGVDVYTYPENITIYDESDKAISVSKLNIQWFKANADGSKGEPVANFEWNTTLKNRELGDYYIYYYIRDKAGNLAETHRIVTLQDTTKPEIIINGNSEEHISLGSEYTDAGFTVSDNRDDASQITTVTKITWYSLTGDSSEVSQVNKDIEGRYNIDYIATDRAGNKQKATRLVYVEDNTTLDFAGISYDTSVDGEVTVTITANKKIKLNSGWEYTDSSKKAMYKVYTENTDYLGEDITVSDLKGATKVANILVTSIVTNGTRNVNVTSKAGFDKLVVDMRSGVTFKNAVINIDTDIDLSNENWTSIYAGQNNNIFSNTIIDGKEHKITGMKVSRNPATNDGRSEATQYGIGFIGDLNGSLTIKNLTFDGAQVIDANGGTGSNYSQHYAGVVVGHTDAKLKLENVNVSNSKVLNSWQCGGLVGFSGEDITFDNCSVSNTFVGGTNATSGALFGMGSVNVNINNCKANKVKLYSDGLTWDSVQKIDSIYWIGDNYKYHSHSGKTISIDADSTITDVSIVDTLE